MAGALSVLPKSGIILPRVGKRGHSLADALLTKTQQRVLGLLFGAPGRSFYASELIRRAGAGSGAVQRELLRLESSGLVSVRRIGSQRHYQANPESPIYSELYGIIRKTVGLAEPLREALARLAPKIVAAFVYGSIAKGRETAKSDVDLFVVSDSLTYGDIFSALEPLSIELGRAINPTVYSRQELERRKKAGNAFATRIVGQPKIWVIGSERDIAA